MTDRRCERAPFATLFSLLSAGLLCASSAWAAGTSTPPVLLEVNPPIQFQQSSSQLLAIRFDDPFSKIVKPQELISVDVEGILGAGVNVPINQSRVSFFIERQDLTGRSLFVRDFEQTGAGIRISKPGRYLIKAVVKGPDVQSGLVFATKIISVR